MSYQHAVGSKGESFHLQGGDADAIGSCQPEDKLGTSRHREPPDRPCIGYRALARMVHPEFIYTATFDERGVASHAETHNVNLPFTIPLGPTMVRFDDIRSFHAGPRDCRCRTTALSSPTQTVLVSLMHGG